ncbi:MAG: hypothetical protein AABX52_01275 [Nanoarchaeota archaeon]
MDTLPENWREIKPLTRLEFWWDVNYSKFGENAPIYKTLLENFYLTCKQPQLHDYLNFENDIKHYKTSHQVLLQHAFCIMYNTTPTCIANKFQP